MKIKIKTPFFILLSIFMYFSFLFCSTEDSIYISHKKLIEDYLAKETKGDFLKRSPWLKNNIINFKIIPGFDTFKIIDEYNIKITFESDDTVGYVVDYKVIGRVLQDGDSIYVQYNIQNDFVNYKLIKIVRRQWMLLHPLTPYHLFTDNAKQYLPKNEVKKLNEYKKNNK